MTEQAPGDVIFELSPPDCAGPILIGILVEDAMTVLEGLPGITPRDPSMPDVGTLVSFESGLGIAVGARAGRVHCVEIYGPAHGVRVDYDGLAVLDLPADEVIAALRERTRVDVVEGGRTAVAPDLLLALRRSTVPEDGDDGGIHFESVLIAAPGYYDTPSGRPSYLD